MQRINQTPRTEPPDDLLMYWLPLSSDSYWDPPVPAPIWQMCDENEAPEQMSFVAEDGTILL